MVKILFLTLAVETQLGCLVDKRYPKSRGEDAALKLRNPIHGPPFGVKLYSPPWALSVVNGLCLRSERLVLAVSALTGECLR